MSLKIPDAIPLDPKAPCALCGSTEGRQLSHIIPKFVFQHANVRSPTGYMRTNISPNKREQDGLKEYLLCRNCEQRFSKWETKFAPLFKKHHEKPGESFAYDRGQALAALSIVWRVLASARSHPELNHLTFGRDYSRTDSAFQVWSEVLLEHRPHPDKFRLNWLWFDYVTNGPKNLNRYIFHATDYDVYASDRESYTVAHLPGLFLVGTTELAPKNAFKGFGVSFKGGQYISREDKVCPAWLQEYMTDKLKVRDDALAQMSPVQVSKIEQIVLRDPEAALSSPLFRTVLHDIAAHQNN